MAAQQRDDQTETMRLMEKRKKLQEAERALAEERNKFTEEMKLLDQRKEQYEKKKAEFTRQALSCEVIFKSNQEKQANDRKKVLAENQQIAETMRLKALREVEWQSIKLERARVAAESDRYKCYADYLEGITDDSQAFQSIKARYDTLSRECNGLLETIRKYADDKEELTHNFQENTTSLQNRIFALTARVDALQKEYKLRRATSTQQESTMHLEEEALSKALVRREIEAVTSKPSASKAQAQGPPTTLLGGSNPGTVGGAGGPAGDGHKVAGSRLGQEQKADPRSREQIRLAEIRQKIELLKPSRTQGHSHNNRPCCTFGGRGPIRRTTIHTGVERSNDQRVASQCDREYSTPTQSGAFPNIPIVTADISPFPCCKLFILNTFSRVIRHRERAAGGYPPGNSCQRLDHPDLCLPAPATFPVVVMDGGVILQEDSFVIQDQLSSLPTELLTTIVGNAPFHLEAYCLLQSVNHDIRLRVRGTIRHIDFVEPQDSPVVSHPSRRLFRQKTSSLLNSMELLVGPCQRLESLALPCLLDYRAELSASWADAIFAGRYCLYSLTLRTLGGFTHETFNRVLEHLSARLESFTVLSSSHAIRGEPISALTLLRSLAHGLAKCPQLRELTIEESGIPLDPYPLSALSNLRVLQAPLCSSNILSEVLRHLPDLERLAGVFLAEDLDIKALPHPTRLRSLACSCQELPRKLGRLDGLTSLTLEMVQGGEKRIKLSVFRPFGDTLETLALSGWWVPVTARNFPCLRNYEGRVDALGPEMFDQLTEALLDLAGVKSPSYTLVSTSLLKVAKLLSLSLSLSLSYSGKPSHQGP
ncbi:hypothetical protein PAPYR_6534 [Paratrimastix pyriformis]|uniref:DUF4200 domain-containing protein n=1 Tax=Paratrimastix pyriformis TaxID=342808 RepID=A0ABQ8UEZ2_9EUKA|nr:hypothetical protein PAPYR_6534 [Paratrimastix pyriformis]